METDVTEQVWKMEKNPINDTDGLGETSETALCSLHLVACCVGFPFMLKGILKSVGICDDVSWTCFEFKWFYLGPNNVQRRLSLSDFVLWRVRRFEHEQSSEGFWKSAIIVRKTEATYCIY